MTFNCFYCIPPSATSHGTARMFHAATPAVWSNAIGGSFPYISTLALIVQGSAARQTVLVILRTTAFFSLSFFLSFFLCKFTQY